MSLFISKVKVERVVYQALNCWVSTSQVIWSGAHSLTKFVHKPPHGCIFLKQFETNRACWGPTTSFLSICQLSDRY